MEYFIGIVPPDEYRERVERFQNRWIVRSGVEPHITLKAQGGLTEDLAWLGRVREVCQRFKPFRVSFDGPAYFGETILYLGVQSQELVELHRKIVQAVSPPSESIRRYFELDDFVPHMTLGKEAYGGGISSGVTKEGLGEMEREVRESLSPYPIFEVSFIRVYIFNDKFVRYERYEDIALGDSFIL